MKTRLYYTFVVGTAIAMSNMRAPAQAHNHAAITAVMDTNTPSPAQRALSLLKPAADRISAANAFTFKAQSIVEVPSAVGQIIRYSFDSEIAVRRPNGFASKGIGDQPGLALHYDGRVFSGVDQGLGLFAQIEAPASLDELLPFVTQKSGIYFPCADLLRSDVYGDLVKDLTHAYRVVKSAVGGVQCDHLVFGAPGVEWQVWVGPEEAPLPRRLMVTLLNMERQPRFTVTLSDWDLNPKLPPEHFRPVKPAGSTETGFGRLMAGHHNHGAYYHEVSNRV
jgi:hypothetical protein